MSTNKLTIKLTEDQQRQIRNATGKSVTELNIDVASHGVLNQEDLEKVIGGGKVQHGDL